MTKVFLVRECGDPYEPPYTLGVFSTYNKAHDWMMRRCSPLAIKNDDTYIETWTVDKEDPE